MSRPPAIPPSRELPVQTRELPIGGVDDEARTVDVVFSTGASVRRQRWVGWDSVVPFDESLTVSREAVMLDRINRGGPALDSHSMWSTSSQVGVVERAWIDGKEARATIRFPKAQVDERADRMFALVKDGIIRNISVGYIIHKVRVLAPEKIGDVEQRIVERWEPLEISFVTVPADAGAQVRSGQSLFPVEVVNRAPGAPQEVLPMDSETQAPSPQIRTDPAAPPAPPVLDEAAIRRAAIESERARASTIRTRVAGVNLPVSVADDLISRGVDLAHVGDAIVDELARRGSQTPARPTIEPGQDHTDPAAIRIRMAGAIVAHATRHLPAGHRAEMPAESRDFDGMSVLAMMADLARAHGHKIDRRLPSPALYESLVGIRALSTSDFPLLLADAGNKILVKSYELAAPTYRLIFARKTFNDFKPHKFLRGGDFPQLLQVGETGEVQFGTMSEAKNEITMATYARAMGISRRMIVNDELGAFGDLPMKAGRRVSDFENATAWAILALNSGAGPTIYEKNMPSGRALFHTDHANYTSSGTVIDVTNVGVGRAAMMKQTSLDGMKLNVEPNYLVTSPDKYTQAEQFCAINIVAATDANANPFKGRLTPVGDANLSGNAWYLFANPGSSAETLVYGYLQGLEGPRMASREGFTTEGVDLRVSLDFAVGAYDFRGAYKNAGA